MCHFYLLKEHPLQFIGFGPFPFPLGQLGDIHHDILATQKAGTALYNQTKNNNPKIMSDKSIGISTFLLFSG
jgi:hypothetical protein